MKSATKTGRLLMLILAGALLFFVSFLINVAPVNAALIRDTKVVWPEPDKSFFTDSDKFVNVQGATATVTLPSDRAKAILVRFSGASSCYGNSRTYCLIRILVNGQPIVSASDFFIFDYAKDEYYTGPQIAGHTMEAITTERLLPGTYQVQVQACGTRSKGDYPLNAKFSLTDWFLTVQVIEVPM